MNSKQRMLTEGPIVSSLILFAIPILIGNLFQQLYNAADAAIVANYLGESSLAAVGASGSIFDLTVGFATGLANGMGIVVARYFGAKDMKSIKKSVAMSIVIGIGVSVMIMLFAVFCLRTLLEFVNTPKSILDEAFSYIFVIMLFFPVTFFYNFMAGILRAIGNSIFPVVVLVIAAAVNVFLDIFMITRVRMGIQGAAVATVIAQTLAVVACMVYIAFRARILLPKVKHFRFEKRVFAELFSQGMAMGFMQSIVSIGSVILQTSVNAFGVTIIGAQTAARRIFYFAILPVQAVSNSVTTMVSQNYGAGNMKRIREVVKIALIINVLINIFIGILVWFSGGYFTYLLTGSENAQLLNVAVLYLRVMIFFWPVLGCLFVLRNSLQGVNRKIEPLISSGIELLMKILFVLFVIPKVGYVGVMFTEPVIWVFMTAWLSYSFVRDKRIMNA